MKSLFNVEAFFSLWQVKFYLEYKMKTKDHFYFCKQSNTEQALIECSDWKTKTELKLTTHDTILGQLCGECGHSFRKCNFPMFPCDQAVFSSPASPLTSLCSWWDQPFLGTLVVVILQLPCERKVVKGKDGRGDKRKGWIKTPSKGQSDLSESSRPAD